MILTLFNLTNSYTNTAICAVCIHTPRTHGFIKNVYIQEYEREVSMQEILYASHFGDVLNHMQA